MAFGSRRPTTDHCSSKRAPKVGSVAIQLTRGSRILRPFALSQVIADRALKLGIMRIDMADSMAVWFRT